VDLANSGNLANVWRNTSGTPVKGCPVMMRVSDKTIITITEIKKNLLTAPRYGASPDRASWSC
jgi:hypothetical protein